MKNGKYLVGIVGFGGIARIAHYPGWKKLSDVEVIAIADPSEEVRNIAKNQFNIKYVFDDYKKILKIDEIDIIDVCTPNKLHYPVVIDSLKSKKHVLCEKPIGISGKEVEEMIKTSKMEKRKLMAAQHMRFTKSSIVLKKYIDNGELGQIYFSIANALRRRYLPARDTFIDKNLSGGGPLFDIGVHILDLTYWFMGCPKVYSVTGITLTKLAKRKDIHGLWGEWDREKYNVEDFASGFIKFKDGSALNLTCSFLANIEQMEDFSTTLFGTEGGIKWPSGKLAKEKYGVLQNIELMIDLLPDNPPHHEEIRVFFECVKEDKEVPVKPEESLEVIKMLEGIYISSETGKELIFK
ncbi:MAG: Gfo/Idh/MocA family oxidoreductase [Candidatus Omnitrophica bacterium]|nr:Gfo/Idh/MocA family oxidoreductase [Candidatus Omnitrophota bacterium]